MRLCVRTGEDAGREVAFQDERPVVLGRERGCDVVLRDPRASRRHAELRPLTGGRVLLRDLGSTNGTWVGGERIAEAVLAGGEELRLGDVRLALSSALAAPEAPAPEVARIPQPPTYSMVGRIVEARTRRTQRLAVSACALAAILAAGVGGLVLSGGGDRPDGERVPGVVADVAPSTVLVEAIRSGSRTGTGSGWVLDGREGLVVTSAHVLNQGDAIRVAAGGHDRPATVVGAAPCEDIALLRVADPSGLRSARLGTGAGVRQGETVVALGYAANAAVSDELTSTTGVVSVARTAYRDGAADLPPLPEAVQTDTALNPGNSGGPLVDLDGRLVGMNAAVRTAGADGRTLQNQNYAIAVDRIRAVVARLRAGRPAGWTGLTFAYPSATALAERRLPAGLLVTGAAPGSPAARAGLAETTDALVAVDGRPVGTTLSSYCAAAGDAPARLSFAESGSGRVRDVRLGARP